jgi:hypothetical protein
MAIDEGKKNIVYIVPPKPFSEMTREEILEMGGQLFDAIKAKSAAKTEQAKNDEIVRNLEAALQRMHESD